MLTAFYLFGHVRPANGRRQHMQASDMAFQSKPHRSRNTRAAYADSDFTPSPPYPLRVQPGRYLRLSKSLP
jgi:hypothetical protein